MGEWIYRSTFFLTSALIGGEWSPLRPGRFSPGTHWIRGWVGSRAGLDDVEEEKILDPTGTRTPNPLSSSPWPVAIPIPLSRLWSIFMVMSCMIRIVLWSIFVLMSVIYKFDVLRLKGSIFYGITSCSPLKVNRHVPPKSRSTFSGLHDVIH
jgi:hypothetical protein